MRRGTALLAGSIAAATMFSAALPPGHVLVWNATASVPTGLYFVSGARELRVGQRVAIAPSPALRRFLAVRGYLPAGLPLLKEVAALPGDTVCRQGPAITVNGERLGTALAADRRGRLLPVWQGCRALAADEVFAMNRHAPSSFDGRYFGPISRSRLIGRASPIWTDETGSGEHVWFASPRSPHHHRPQRRRTMTRIGTFTATADGFEGRLRTLTLDSTLTIVAAEPSEAENAPDYRIIAGDGETAFEVGAGWKRVGDKAGDYVAVLIDDPAFVQPLRANLFDAGSGEHVLTWSRPSRRAGKA